MIYHAASVNAVGVSAFQHLVQRIGINGKGQV
jgi:hypothetical protein